MTRITFLGTGTSNGIPVIGCQCEVCCSSDPRDKRGRTSALIQHNGLNFLLDTATELRTQALVNQVDRIDAVLYTHAHADHTGGIDDLRRFNELAGKHLPIYAGEETAETLVQRYQYAFDDTFPFYGGKPDLIMHEVNGPFQHDGTEIIPIPVWHGKMPVLGYRFGDLAYITDAKSIPDETKSLLRNLDLLVLNGLRDRPHPTHLSIQEAVGVIEELTPRRAYLVHLSHEIGHQAATELLPDNVEIAWDGLTIDTVTIASPSPTAIR